MKNLKERAIGAAKPRITLYTRLIEPTPRKKKTVNNSKEHPEPAPTAKPKRHSVTAPQALYESALIAFLAATMSFFEPLQVPLRSLFEKIIKKSRFSDLFFLNQIFEFFNSLFRYSKDTLCSRRY